ncbi:DUF4236 domain-containing protein [Klebsiella phage 05F01]|nr:DUF4236 domain-containing protein [Klebsiella phage 05F01]
MGLRFRKRIKVIPGVYINFGKKGVNSVSVGGNGLTANVNRNGTKTTVGLPGTGLSYETKRASGGSVFKNIILIIILALLLYYVSK